MQLISKQSKRLNSLLHSSNPAFGPKNKYRWFGMIRPLLLNRQPKTVLDYGCGKGGFKQAIIDDNFHVQFQLYEYDPAIYGKDDLPPACDFVVCTDVLEHVEREYLDNVVKHLTSCIKDFAFISIALRKGKKKLANSKYAHRVIESEIWWMQKINEHLNGDWTLTAVTPEHRRERDVVLTIETIKHSQ